MSPYSTTTTSHGAGADSNEADASHYYADRNAPICPLVIREHFNTLTNTEKHYAHHLSRASWLGARIILEQTTPHSSELFDLIRLLFAACSEQPNTLCDLDAFRTQTGLSADSFQSLLEYSAQLLSNLANYKSFGDSKFIPRLPANEFRQAVAASPQHEKALPLFEKLEQDIYAYTPSARTLLGYPDEGHVTHYYSANITKEDAQLVQKFCESKQIEALNTRLFKKEDGTLDLVVASADQTIQPETHTWDGRTIVIRHGDYSTTLTGIVAEIEAAIPYAANDHQRKMLQHYANTFRTGSIEEHKASQREWIRDLGPAVETNIGFVESYRDPVGVRAEFEGFVAVVNKEMTKKFERLVQSAPIYIPKLPWGSDFEKEEFLKPDFTSLEILTFSTGGVPAGINIPNYDDIRQTFGFKNVSLGNVLNAKAPNEKVPFLSEEDRALFEKLRGPAFEVQVGIHELLGHGSGKLLQIDEDGKGNFPPSLLNPVTGKKVAPCYQPGETWGSKFKAIAASYEECRAESVAMFLSTEKSMLEIFGHTDESKDVGLADDIMYIGWLQMCRAGLLGLEFYDPSARKWGQAHMQARYAILHVLLKAGQGLVQILPQGDDGLLVQLDRTKIESVGKPAISDFLLKLQVYKACADAESGQALYDEVTTVPDDWLSYRKIVLSKKQPRKLLLQANTVLNGDQVALREYPADLGGFIQSYLERDI